MVNKTIRLISLTVILLFSSSLAACSEEVSVEVGLHWYQENKAELMALHQLLVTHPAIERVDLGRKLEFVPKYGDFNAETEKAYREIEKRTVELGIKTIAIYRPRESFADELYSVGYVIKTKGYSVTKNSAVLIDYVAKKSLLDRHKSEAFRVLVPLDVPGWYVHYYSKD